MTEPTRTGELLDRIKAGDRAAWDEIVRQYTPLLWSVARSLSLSEEEAADAVQSTWLRLIQALSTTHMPSSLPRWLVTVMHREAGRLARHSSVGAAPTMPDTPPDPEAIVVRHEQEAILWRAMQQLPQRCQTLLMIMLDNERPSYYDIATALDMPAGSVGPTRGRCLQRLRILLETMGYRDEVVLASEDNLVRTLRETPRLLDTVPSEVIEGAVRARETE